LKVKSAFQIKNLDLDISFAEEVDRWKAQQQAFLMKDPSSFPVAFSLATRQTKSCTEHVLLPEGWHPLTLLRAHLLLTPTVFERAMDWIEETFRTADLGESLDLYRLLPLVDLDKARSKMLWRMGEGLRSNAPPIFEAVAHHSLLPSGLLGEEAWNQMILKALFIECPIQKIEGWQGRRNPTLDTMVLRFASERAMAHREIPADVWKLVMNPISAKGAVAVKYWIESHPREHFVHLLKSRFQK
jgi:hypothetical protein